MNNQNAIGKPKEYLCGSRYFFDSIADLKDADTDKVIIIDNPNIKYAYNKVIANTCYFYIKKQDKKKVFNYALQIDNTYEFGRYVIPEINEEFGITLEDLKILEPILERLDNRHKYIKTIYEAYLENNSMTLTDSQRLAAYEIYKKYRTNNVK